MPKVSVGDVNIYYEEQGDGETIALVMGLGGAGFPGCSARFRRSQSNTG
jgi:hypothetical protein